MKGKRIREWIGVAGFGLLAAVGVMMGASGLAAAEAGGEDEAAYAYRESLFLSELQRESGYAQAVRVGGVVLVSATTGPGESLAEQLKAAYVRVQAALGHFGLRMSDVAQERIYTVDMDALQDALESRSLYYRGETLPAVTWVEVMGLAEEGRLVAVEVMAVASEEE